MADRLRAPALFHWPATAAFGRAVPKTKLYEHGNARTSLREKFIDEVQRITWAYKLADDTVRLRGTTAVPEIQVFAIEAKGANVSNDVLSAIDKAVHFPIIFEVLSGERVRTVAAPKSLGGKTPTVGEYYSTDWQPADAARRPVPAALDLPGLYEAILSALLPVTVRAGETASEASARLDRTRKLEREIAGLEKRLRTEPQLNRKIELRRKVKERTEVLADLIDPVPSNKE
jgi:hypothetical protein